MKLKPLLSGLFLLFFIMSGSAFALDIPLTLEEPDGITRSNEPVTSGIPLPSGTQTTNWSLWDGTHQIPLQVTRLQGGTPWILLDFQINVSASGKKNLILRDTPSTVSPAKPLTIFEDSSQIIVITGPIKILMKKNPFNLFEAVWIDRNNDGNFATEEQIINSSGDNIQIIDSSSRLSFTGTGNPEKLVWEYRGQIRSTLRIDGRYTKKGISGFLAYTTRITFYAGRSDVKIEHILRNSSQRNERHVKVTSAILKIGEGGATISAACTGMENRETCTGPLVAWTNIGFGGTFELIPAARISNKGLVIPDLSYYGAGVVMDFAEGLSPTEQIRRRTAVNSLLFALAPQSWYSQYGNLSTSQFGTLDDEKKTYQNWGWTWSPGQEPREPHRPNYWVSWKDVSVHEESEADDLWQHLVMYIRTGQRGYFDRALAWARYLKWEYTFRTDGFDFAWDGNWERPGVSRPKLDIPLTSQDQSYLSSDVQPGRIDCRARGACHLYGWGLIDYYWLTGDIDALEAATDIGEISERIFGWRTPGSHRMGEYGLRQGARHLLFATHLYEVTQNTRWKNLMNLLAQLWIRSPDYDIRGFYPFGQYITDNKVAKGAYIAGARAVSTFELGLLSHAFGEYYRITGNPEIRNRAVALANWVKQYAFQSPPTPAYIAMTIALDWPSPGKVWQSSTTGSGAYTVSLVDTLVRGYRLSGDNSLLDRAKLHWDLGTRGTKGGIQVGRFTNSRILSDNLYYSSNRGDLPYNHLLFHNVSGPPGNKITWTGIWTKISPSGIPIKGDRGACGSAPCGRVWVPGTFDSKRNLFVIFGGGIAGGCDSGYVNDLWTYSYSQNLWKQILPIKRSWEGADNINWPKGRDNHMLAYDDYQDLYWMYGGTCSDLGRGVGEQAIWSFNPNTNLWNKYPAPAGVSPPTLWARYDTGFAYDSLNRKIVLFGGGVAVTKGDTWTFDTVTKEWSLKIPEGSPNTPPRRTQIENAMVYDSYHKKIVLFGGVDAANNLLNDTWVYDVAMNTWSNMHPPTAPSPRMMHPLIFDSKNKVIVLFGGQISTGGSKGNYAIDDTWIYDLSTNTWAPVKAAGPKPPPLAHHVMAYVSANEVILLWGRSPTFEGKIWSFKLTRSGEVSDTTPPHLDPTPEDYTDEKCWPKGELRIIN
jgi:hypothetical protein